MRPWAAPLLLSYRGPSLVSQALVRHPALWPQSWGAAKQEAGVSSERENPLSAKGNHSCRPEPVGSPRTRGGGVEPGLDQLPCLPISSWIRAGMRSALSAVCL